MYKKSVIWYITFTHSQGHQEMVPIQLLPFLQYVNMALKKYYLSGIWLSIIISGQEFGEGMQVYTYIEGGEYDN